MTREDFDAEFERRFRFVLQKHAREIEARAESSGTPTPALNHANTMLDAAIADLRDLVWHAVNDRTKRGPVQ